MHQHFDWFYLHWIFSYYWIFHCYKTWISPNKLASFEQICRCETHQCHHSLIVLNENQIQHHDDISHEHIQLNKGRRDYFFLEKKNIFKIKFFYIYKINYKELQYDSMEQQNNKQINKKKLKYKNSSWFVRSFFNFFFASAVHFYWKQMKIVNLFSLFLKFSSSSIFVFNSLFFFLLIIISIRWELVMRNVSFLNSIKLDWEWCWIVV